MKHPLAITTLSLIRSTNEEKIVFETVKTMSGLNVPIILVDGGSGERQKKCLQSLPNVDFFETSRGLRGLSERLRIAFSEGAKTAEALFYVHSDKVDFAKHYMKKMIDHYQTLPQHTMLVPSRTPKAFATYPLFQQNTELFLNAMVNEFLGKKEDYYYGPKLFSSALVPYFSKIKGEIGWGYEAFMYMINKRLGYQTEFYEVDNIRSPKDVGRMDDINVYRLRILQWQIEGLLQGMRIKLNNEH